METKEQLIKMLFGIPEDAPGDTVMTRDQCLLLADKYAKAFYENESRELISENGQYYNRYKLLEKAILNNSQSMLIIGGANPSSGFSDYSAIPHEDLLKNLSYVAKTNKILYSDFLKTPTFSAPIKELLKKQSEGKFLTKEEKKRCTEYANTARKKNKK